MLAKGSDLKFISKVTKLTIKEINKLKSEDLINRIIIMI